MGVLGPNVVGAAVTVGLVAFAACPCTGVATFSRPTASAPAPYAVKLVEEGAACSSDSGRLSLGYTFGRGRRRGRLSGRFGR